MHLKICGAVAIAATIAFGVPQLASAHHSTAEFDYSKTVILKGTLTELQWTNPHSHISLLVPTNGENVRWRIEIGNPSINSRAGWTKSSVKKGDKVELDIAPARDGRPYGTLRVLTFQDTGRQLKGVAVRVKADERGFPKFN